MSAADNKDLKSVCFSSWREVQWKAIVKCLGPGRVFTVKFGFNSSAERRHQTTPWGESGTPQIISIKVMFSNVNLIYSYIKWDRSYLSHRVTYSQLMHVFKEGRKELTYQTRQVSIPVSLMNVFSHSCWFCWIAICLGFVVSIVKREFILINRWNFTSSIYWRISRHRRPGNE